MILLLTVSSLVSGDDRNLIFHFNFKGADGKSSVRDATGNYECKSERGSFVVEKGNLRCAVGSKFVIPDPQKTNLSETVTVSGWILKRSTPEVAPILMKGALPRELTFSFGVGWKFPYFARKSQAGGNSLSGIYYNGIFGSSIYYPDAAWLKPGAALAESGGFWYHVCGVYDRGATRLYINGKRVAERQEPSAKLRSNDLPFVVGAERSIDSTENTVSADMLLNDLRLYGSALSAPEVEALYLAERGGYPAGNQIPPGDNHINALGDCYKYLPEEFDPLMERTLPMTAAFEKSNEGKKRPEFTPIRATISKENGLPVIQFNGQSVNPMQGVLALFDFNRNRYKYREQIVGVRDFTAAGVNLIALPVNVHEIAGADGSLDMKKIDETARNMVNANPQIAIMVYLLITPPKWFALKYPDEIEKVYFGASLRDVPAAGPLGSDLWIGTQNEISEKIVRHMESQDYGAHVYAYMAGGGQSSEWYWPGSVYGAFTGYSAATEKSFRTYLAGKYKKDDALQEKWNDGKVTLANAKAPPVAVRIDKSAGLFNFSPAVIDFRDYLTVRTVNAIQGVTSAIKRGCGNRKLTIVYSGYDLPVMSQKLFHAGLSGNWEVMNSPSVDMIATLIDYAQRRGGEPGARINSFDGSAGIAGKFLWHEDDPRTHLSLTGEMHQSKTLFETNEVLKRSAAQGIVRGTGSWWLLFDNSWFHSEPVMQNLKKTVGFGEEAMKKSRKSVAECAIIFDEKSPFYLSQSGSSFLQLHTWWTYQASLRSGGAFDMYYQQDIVNGKMPDYKAYIFLDAYSIDDSQREAIHRKLRKNNAIAVWCYAPGYVLNGKPSLENMRKLTGFQFVSKTLSGKIESVKNKTASPLTAEYTGASLEVNPAFFVQDSMAEILASAAEGATLAVKKVDNWTSVYSLMPLDRGLLRGICRLSGARIYDNSADMFMISESYMMIHAFSAGKKEFMLPKKHNVTELYSNKKWSDADIIEDQAEKGETRLYLIE